MGDTFAGIGDLVFTLVVGYVGALEFLYVLRHLYHWSFRHATRNENDAEGLKQLQNKLRDQLSDAEAKEITEGTKVMKDGVRYSDGFRVDPQHQLIEDLKKQLQSNDITQNRRKEIEIELAKQKKIEEETRKQLEKAEAELAKQRKQAVEDEENAVKLVGAERAMEEKQHEKEIQEEQEENERKLLIAERAQEDKEAAREIEEEKVEITNNNEKLIAIEKENESAQRIQEIIEENEMKQQQVKIDDDTKKSEENTNFLSNERITEELNKSIEITTTLDEEKEKEQHKADSQVKQENRTNTHEEVVIQDLSKEQSSSKLEENITEERLEIQKESQEENKTRNENEENNQIIETTEQSKKSETELLLTEQKNVNNVNNIIADEIKEVEETGLKLYEDNINKAKTDIIETREIKDNEPEEYEIIETEDELNTHKLNENEISEGEVNKVINLSELNLDLQTTLEDSLNQLLDAEEQRVAEQLLWEAKQKEAEEDEIRRVVELVQKQDAEAAANLTRKLLSGKEKNSTDLQAEENERNLNLIINSEQARELKQKLIEENAKKFLEAENEMVTELQRQIDETAQQRLSFDNYGSVPQTPILEEAPCIKKTMMRHFGEPCAEPIIQKVKTQMGQASNESFTVSTKPLLFPGVSDDGSSVEPYSSEQSSFCTQPSDDYTTGNEDTNRTVIMQIPQDTRLEPEGEEISSEVHYSDEYLRSLDGIKHRPILREDSSGRRRAFKKRRSSGSSNSSKDSRTSREEEIKMFTSLEEEESKNINKGDSEFTPIKYTNEPTLKVKSHHRRHKRSPAKDVKTDNQQRSSLEMLGEENTNPWGEVMPEPYKNTEFWKREKAVSIDEETEHEQPVSAVVDMSIATNKPKSMSFEEATETQNNEAILNLKEQKTKETVDEMKEKDSASASDTKENLHTSQNTERNATAIHVIASSCLENCTEIFTSPIKELELTNIQATIISNDCNEDNIALRTEQSATSNSPDDLSYRKQIFRKVSPTTFLPGISIVIDTVEDIQNNTDIMKVTRSQLGNNSTKDIASRDPVAEDDMNTFIQSLRTERGKSRSRSRSPLPTSDNLQRGLENRKNKLIKKNDELYEKLIKSTPILISDNEKNIDSASNTLEHILSDKSAAIDAIDCSQENINDLVKSLRTNRSRSRSKSPIPTAENLSRSIENRRHKLIERNDEIFEQLKERSTTPELPRLTIEYVYEFVEADDDRKQHINGRSRSRTSSSSPHRLPFDSYNFVDRPETVPNFEITDISPFPIIEDTNNIYEFHRMLNLEASSNKTLQKNSEEIESILAEKQRILDREALEIIKTATEETELRTITPIELTEMLENEKSDLLNEIPLTSRLHNLRCTPTTPNYDRTISEEWRDLQEIKNQMRTKNFKRSTYVGESLDIGSEYEPLRREAAKFRRSKSPSPSIDDSLLSSARDFATEKQNIQAHILDELAIASQHANDNLGAKPKYDCSLSKEIVDTQRIKKEMLNSGFKRSTYVGESIDLGAQYEPLRAEAANFQRSRSQSRSPLPEDEQRELQKIESDSIKQKLQDEILKEMNHANTNFREFSQYLNTAFLDNDRRASDSALIQKPEILIQIQDFNDTEMEPDDYHHLRRFSSYQEQPEEEYPNDDYIFVSQVEIKTPNGTRLWTREDFYNPNLIAAQTDRVENIIDNANVVEVLNDEINNNIEHMREEEETDGSEDERRTVVEMDDEIDTDICDYNERGPAEESQHEQSECEEAEREADRYIGLAARDWQEVDNFNEIMDIQFDSHNRDSHTRELEGAAAISNSEKSEIYDADSCAIDQIYDEAIRNRKQSGILRDYDSILLEMQNNYLQNNNCEKNSNDENENSSPRALEYENSDLINNKHISQCFLENERQCSESRYLGNAAASGRQSTRLRMRYGYKPILQKQNTDEIEVDLNYKPKREYNWRKNFKLEEEQTTNEISENSLELQEDEDEVKFAHILDTRKYSLGGESITLFSRSPEREVLLTMPENSENDVGITKAQELEQNQNTTNNLNETKQMNKSDKQEKTKKKKSKKKSRKETKLSRENSLKDEEDSESQTYSRRSSSVQLETDSPKRKSRSRRSSKSSITNDESSLLYSPRNSIPHSEQISDINEEFAELNAEPIKKKTKKRKKQLEVMTKETEVTQNEALHATEVTDTSTLDDHVPVTSKILQEKSTIERSKDIVMKRNIAKATTSTSTAAITSTGTATTATNSTAAATTTTAVQNAESFDILKDLNFYPLF